MFTFIERAQPLILIALMLSVCAGCSEKCYGDIWLPAGSSTWDTGGDTEKSCPDGFELVKVVEGEHRSRQYVSYYCVEEC